MIATMERARVLVVEDENLVAKDLDFRLKKLGYDVTDIVHTGEDALSAVEETEPDLILMDIRLSGDIDGIDTASILMERFDIPVVYLTAYSDDKTLARAKVTGPFGYILKPFEERELRSSIEIALYKHSMDSELKSARREIRVLNGLLPICASCKKIRDDRGYWEQLEVYIREHTNANFTHGYCPECANKFLDQIKRD
jgi:CheY-like chemotaxis protein